MSLIYTMDVYHPPPIGDLVDGRWLCEMCNDPDGKWRPRILAFRYDLGEVLCDACENRIADIVALSERRYQTSSDSMFDSFGDAERACHPLLLEPCIET